MEVAGWLGRLLAVDVAAGDAELIDQITELERVKAACAAAQAALTVAFVASRTAGLTATELKKEGTHRSIGAQIALARRDSPVRGNRHVGLAKALIREMPCTYQALRTGTISEWRATLLVRETACLSIEDRAAVDTELGGRLPSMGDRETAQAAALIAQRLDVASCVNRNRKAIGDRRVSIRPAPDTMAYLTALLPVAHAVAVYAALTRHADTNTGDTRTRGQLMADELVHRTTTPNTGTGTGGVTERAPAPVDAVALIRANSGKRTTKTTTARPPPRPPPARPADAATPQAPRARPTPAVQASRAAQPVAQPVPRLPGTSPPTRTRMTWTRTTPTSPGPCPPGSASTSNSS